MESNDILMSSDIAVIGMDCRFPGANNVQEYWENLVNGKENILFLTKEEIEKNHLDGNCDPEHPDYVRAAAYIEGEDLFDEQFFGYSPREAKLMDPQQRIFLECSWNALESAGYDPYKYELPIGVFAGSRTNTYIYNLLSNREAVGQATQFDIATQNDFSCLSTRVAYKLNLTGPAYSIHTACSTGLSVLHLACQSLLTGECNMAVAGGVAINNPQKTGYLYQTESILSPDGHCIAFDEKSQGTVFGSGIGVVVLKMLENAICDGDIIHAVIKGSASNNDGKRKANYTAPSADGQAKVIKDAVMMSNVDPSTITMLEAHGTGTNLGDPIEVRALTRVYRQFTDRTGYCALGSVKTNLGHLDAAAGMAGLIKVILSLKNKMIPPTLHYTKQNPDIKFEETPFYVNTKLQEWKSGGSLRRAGVSAFGIGGTNVHVILEEAPAISRTSTEEIPRLLLFSAKTKKALKSSMENIKNYLRENQDSDLGDVAFTLANRCTDFTSRFAVSCASVDEAILNIEKGRQSIEYDEKGADDIKQLFLLYLPATYANREAFLKLYDEKKLFRDKVDDCCNSLASYIENVMEILTDKEEERGFRQDIFINFIVEYSFSWYAGEIGLEPSALCGSGIGMMAALCAARVFSVHEGGAILNVYHEVSNQMPITDDRAKGVFQTALQDYLVNVEVKTPSLPVLIWDKEIKPEKLDCFHAASLTNMFFPSQISMDALYRYLETGEGIFLTINEMNGQDMSSDIIHLIPPNDRLQFCHNSIMKTAACLWKKGIDINWAKSFAGEKRRRVTLPNYPMDKKRHWIDAKLSSGNTDQQSFAARRMSLDQWFYTPDFKGSVFLSAREGTDESKKTWLILTTSDNHLSTIFMDKLRMAEHMVIRVTLAEDYDYVDEYEYRLNAEQEEEYDILFDDLKIAGHIPDRIVSFWSMLPSKAGNTFYHLISIARALEENHINKKIELISFTVNLYQIIGQFEGQSGQAMAIGAGLAVSQEYPEYTYRNIDVDLKEYQAETKLVDKIITDICSEDRETIVAYRFGKRWVPSYARLQVDHPHLMKDNLRHKGVYLITGILESGGKEIADYLINQYDANIILLYPKGAEAEKRIGIDYDPNKIIIKSIDFACLDNLESAIKEAEGIFGTIHGVIHAAELSASSFIREKENKIYKESFAVKVNGTVNLFSIFNRKSLDFFLVFSSINSFFGELGQAHICAGNCFLNAFSQEVERSKKIPFTVINWDTRLEDINKIANSFARIEFSETVKNIFDQERNYGITAGEVLEAFLCVVNYGELSQIIISPTDIGHRLERLNYFMKELKEMERNITSPKAMRSPRPYINVDYVAPRNKEEEEIAEIMADILGIDQIGVQDNFFELGGHSLLATYLVGRLKEKCGIKVTIDMLYKEPTIEGIMKTKEESVFSEDSREDILDFLKELSDEEAEAALMELETKI